MWIVEDDLAAAVVESPLGPEPLAQAALVEAIHRQTDVLPVRYGLTLPDERAVRMLLGQRRVELLRGLAAVRDASEFCLRIHLRAPCESAADGGHRAQLGRSTPNTLDGAADGSRAATPPAQYLALRRQHYRQRDQAEESADRAADYWTEALAGSYRACRRLAAPSPAVLRLAFLVARGGCNDFRQRVALLQRSAEELQCSLLGPWPPYSFAEPMPAVETTR